MGLFTTDKHVQRCYTWIFFLRIAGILISIAALGASASLLSAMKDISCNTPPKIAYNVAAVRSPLFSLNLVMEAILQSCHKSNTFPSRASYHSCSYFTSSSPPDPRLSSGAYPFPSGSLSVWTRSCSSSGSPQQPPQTSHATSYVAPARTSFQTMSRSTTGSAPAPITSTSEICLPRGRARWFLTSAILDTHQEVDRAAALTLGSHLTPSCGRFSPINHSGLMSLPQICVIGAKRSACSHPIQYPLRHLHWRHHPLAAQRAQASAHTRRAWSPNHYLRDTTPNASCSHAAHEAGRLQPAPNVPATTAAAARVPQPKHRRERVWPAAEPRVASAEPAAVC